MVYRNYYNIKLMFINFMWIFIHYHINSCLEQELVFLMILIIKKFLISFKLINSFKLLWIYYNYLTYSFMINLLSSINISPINISSIPSPNSSIIPSLSSLYTYYLLLVDSSLFLYVTLFHCINYSSLYLNKFSQILKLNSDHNFIHT